PSSRHSSAVMRARYPLNGGPASVATAARPSLNFARTASTRSTLGQERTRAVVATAGHPSYREAPPGQRDWPARPGGPADRLTLLNGSLGQSGMARPYAPAARSSSGLGSNPRGDPIASTATAREAYRVDEDAIRRNAAIRASIDAPTEWGADPLRDLID